MQSSGTEEHEAETRPTEAVWWAQPSDKNDTSFAFPMQATPTAPSDTQAAPTRMQALPPQPGTLFYALHFRTLSP